MASPAALVQELPRLGGKGELEVSPGAPLALFMAIWSRSAWHVVQRKTSKLLAHKAHNQRNIKTTTVLKLAFLRAGG